MSTNDPKGVVVPVDTAALRKLAEEGGWVPVDQVPEEWKDGRPLLVAFDMTQCTGDEIEIARYERDEDMPGGYAWYSSTGDSAWPIDIDPTHCRALPSSPDTPSPTTAALVALCDEVDRLRPERDDLIEGLVKVEHTAMQDKKGSWKDAQIGAIRRIAHNHLTRVGVETLANDDPRRALLPSDERAEKAEARVAEMESELDARWYRERERS